jgi:hypothetical protein
LENQAPANWKILEMVLWVLLFFQSFGETLTSRRTLELGYEKKIHESGSNKTYHNTVNKNHNILIARLPFVFKEGGLRNAGVRGV